MAIKKTPPPGATRQQVESPAESSRIAPGRPLLETHVPTAVFADGEILLTSALFDAQWMHHPTRSIETALAPLHFVVIGALFDADRVYANSVERDVLVLEHMERCYSSVLSAQFWIDLLQQWCVSPGRAALPHRPMRSLLEDEENAASRINESDHWRQVLLRNELFRKVFNCR